LNYTRDLTGRFKQPSLPACSNSRSDSY